MFHRLDFRAHCHATEEKDRVLKAFAFVSGVNKPGEAEAQGFHGNPIIILRASVRQPRAIQAFWERVRKSGELDGVLKALDRRIDDDCRLHLRFDKQEAYRGRLKVVRHDDVVSLRAKVAAYPARKQEAVRAVESYFRGG